MALCSEIAFSNEYADYLSFVSIPENEFVMEYNIECLNKINNRFNVAYVKRSEISFDQLNSKISVPRLFAPMDDGALLSTQVQRVRDNPFLELMGSGVMVGVVDSGID